MIKLSRLLAVPYTKSINTANINVQSERPGDLNMDYEVVIGLEVHAQLLTDSKMFCSCSARYQEAEPNTVVCPVCMALPGVLPVINRAAVEHVIRTGLAINCEISEYTKFDRKNYPYPDLMKGYQISQFDQAIANKGVLPIVVNGEAREIAVTRVHLEEDVAKLMHRTEDSGEGYSLMDINRAGVPLMEIVSEPDMRNADEAREYLTTLRSIVRYVGAGTANMEEGSFRCDANISIRPVGATELGPKVEVKNMNSLRAVYRALLFEEERQVRAMSEGEVIEQETRGWVEERGVTVSQRSKEQAHDYRYFPEPDLPPLLIDREWVNTVQQSLPELPVARQQRFVTVLGLPEDDADILTASKDLADYFEAVLAEHKNGKTDANTFAKAVSNWILTELLRLLNSSDTVLDSVKVTPSHLAELIEMVESDQLSNTMAKSVFEKIFETGERPAKIAEDEGMSQISDTSAITSAIDEVIEANPQPAQDYIEGKDSAIRFLVGQVMKITRGKANPQMATELLKDKLDSLR